VIASDLLLTGYVTRRARWPQLVLRLKFKRKRPKSRNHATC